MKKLTLVRALIISTILFSCSEERIVLDQNEIENGYCPVDNEDDDDIDPDGN